MLSAICFNLDQSSILSSGNRLMDSLFYNDVNGTCKMNLGDEFCPISLAYGLYEKNDN